MPLVMRMLVLLLLLLLQLEWLLLLLLPEQREDERLVSKGKKQTGTPPKATGGATQ